MLKSVAAGILMGLAAGGAATLPAVAQEGGAAAPAEDASGQRPEGTSDRRVGVRLVQVQADRSQLFPRDTTNPKEIRVNPFSPESLRFFFRVR